MWEWVRQRLKPLSFRDSYRNAEALRHPKAKVKSPDWRVRLQNLAGKSARAT
jgi:hypothetical protein